MPSTDPPSAFGDRWRRTGRRCCPRGSRSRSSSGSPRSSAPPMSSDADSSSDSVWLAEQVPARRAGRVHHERDPPVNRETIAQIERKGAVMVAISEEHLGVRSRDSEQRGRKFPWSLRGYRRSAVDQHIAELEREVSELDRELIELRAAATLREEVANEMRRIGEETAGVLIEAHRRRDTIVRTAEEEAHRLVADAAAKATAITSEAEMRVRELEGQRVTAHQERDRLLQNALAASAAIAEAVHTAHQQVPAIAGD